VYTSDRQREALYILCPASSLMDVPGSVNPDKLINVPIKYADNGANLPLNSQGTKGIAEQLSMLYIAFEQAGQDKQQTNGRLLWDSQLAMQG